MSAILSRPPSVNDQRKLEENLYHFVISTVPAHGLAPLGAMTIADIIMTT